MKKVYGKRICRSCRGICHENSYSKKKLPFLHGQRRSYWCSKNCLKWKLLRDVEKGIPIKYKHLIKEENFIDHVYLDFMIKEFYIKIDVITK